MKIQLITLHMRLLVSVRCPGALTETSLIMIPVWPPRGYSCFSYFTNLINFGAESLSDVQEPEVVGKVVQKCRGNFHVACKVMVCL